MEITGKAVLRSRTEKLNPSLFLAVFGSATETMVSAARRESKAMIEQPRLVSSLPLGF